MAVSRGTNVVCSVVVVVWTWKGGGLTEFSCAGGGGAGEAEAGLGRVGGCEGCMGESKGVAGVQRGKGS